MCDGFIGTGKFSARPPKVSQICASVREAVREELRDFLDEHSTSLGHAALGRQPVPHEGLQCQGSAEFQNVPERPKKTAHAWTKRHMRGFVACSEGNAVDGALQPVKEDADGETANQSGFFTKRLTVHGGRRASVASQSSIVPRTSRHASQHRPRFSIDVGPSPPDSVIPCMPKDSETPSEDELSLSEVHKHSSKLGTRAFLARNSSYFDEPEENEQSFIGLLVMSTQFESLVGTCIVLNALSIGIQTDYMATTAPESVPAGFRACELSFCFIFTMELVLRLIAFRRSFFSMPGWAWNIFDCAIVLMQIMDEIATMIIDHLDVRSRVLSLSFVRVLRVFRIIRIIRLARILRLIGELRTLVASVISSLGSFGWTVLLLLLFIYTGGVFFTQLVSDYIASHDVADEELTRYYGSVWTSVQSLFQAITGGLDWAEVSTPLSDSISPFMAPVFMLYIAFAVLAMMNIVTGIFVESALASAKADKDIFMLNNMRELFLQLDCGLKGEMEWWEFESQLDGPEMQEYFRQIDVDPSEARGVFQLLDIDDSGHITAEEFLSGSIRLRGSAKALDLALLIYEFKSLTQWIEKHAAYVESCLSNMTVISAPAPIIVAQAPEKDSNSSDSLSTKTTDARLATSDATKNRNQRQTRNFSMTGLMNAAQPQESSHTGRSMFQKSVIVEGPPGSVDVEEISAEMGRKAST